MTEEMNGENLVLNLNDYDEDPGFEAIPPGTYDAVVALTEFKYSQSSGNPMIEWRFKITHPDYQNRMVFDHTVLNNEIGIGRLKKYLKRICPDIDMDNFNPKTFAEEGHAIGLPCKVKLKIEKYQGRDQNKVTDVQPAGDAGGFLDD